MTPPKRSAVLQCFDLYSLGRDGTTVKENILSPHRRRSRGMVSRGLAPSPDVAKDFSPAQLATQRETESATVLAVVDDGEFRVFLQA
jgi:hypothetical protein